MVDSFILLAPVLLLAVVALLAFAGCDVFFPLEGPELLFRTNCGGPAVVDDDLGWASNNDPNPAGVPELGSPFENAAGNPAQEIYDTCRLGNPNLKYSF